MSFPLVFFHHGQIESTMQNFDNSATALIPIAAPNTELTIQREISQTGNDMRLRQNGVLRWCFAL
jgi:hypothetical protein